MISLFEVNMGRNKFSIKLAQQSFDGFFSLPPQTYTHKNGAILERYRPDSLERLEFYPSQFKGDYSSSFRYFLRQDKCCESLLLI